MCRITLPKVNIYREFKNFEAEGSVMKKLVNYFFKGLLVFTPIALTGFVVFWVVGLISKHLTIPMGKHTIPGGGLIILLILFPVIGFITSRFLGRKLFEWFERLITKIPLIKLLYNSLKDLMGAFAGEKKSFNKPVLVDITGNDSAKIIGFVTRESLNFLNIKDHVAVYLPQSYNFAGNVFIFPSKNVKPIDADASEVMAFIVSAGVSGPKE